MTERQSCERRSCGGIVFFSGAGMVKMAASSEIMAAIRTTCDSSVIVSVLYSARKQKQRPTGPGKRGKEMKNKSMNRLELVRWLIAGFLFCMCGVLMQIIAPPTPNYNIEIGIVFFVLMLGFGFAIWRIYNKAREERAAAFREEKRREHEQ